MIHRLEIEPLWGSICNQSRKSKAMQLPMIHEEPSIDLNLAEKLGAVCIEEGNVWF